MTAQTHIRWDRGANDIVVLTMDAPGQTANTMSEDFLVALASTVQRLEDEKDGIAGVVITSAKKTFFAGGDLNEILNYGPADAARLMETSKQTKAVLRRLETLGRPVVAAINGAALGGGFELALACHHRIALDDRTVQIGLPEVTLGLLPGAGGIVRTVRLLGVLPALDKVLIDGRRFGAREARETGLVHDLAATPADLLDAARTWITANADAMQPWDRPGYRLPGGEPRDRSLAGVIGTLPAGLRKRLRGAPMQAQENILSAAVEGARVDFENAQLIESRYFVELVTGQIAKNMIQAFFFDMQHVKSGGSRPVGFEPWRATRVGVLGAGLMGAGIAHVCAEAGIEVVLKDTTLEAAQRGKQYSDRILTKRVEQGKLDRAAADAILDRIQPTESPKEFDGCDLVIEAVFEDPAVKREVFREIEDIVEPGCLLGSNTSTLPITDLAEAVRDRANFVGLHFFSPVERMPLLEIIVGKETSDAALAKAFDLAQQIRKTPIVVNDSRGFFTSRVIREFVQEAVAMVGEGVPAASIEQAAVQAGYPVGPLSLLDDLSLSLMRKIVHETRDGLRASGQEMREHPSFAVLDRMIDEFGRAGRPSGGGFYNYLDGRRGAVWPGLADAFGSNPNAIAFVDLQERMLFSEALDAIRCLDEGVLRSVPDANVGSLLGIGFPSWTGGVLQYVNQYDGGLAGFVERARELAERFGERFEPPASLVARAESGQIYA